MDRRNSVNFIVVDFEDVVGCFAFTPGDRNEMRILYTEWCVFFNLLSLLLRSNALIFELPTAKI
jgi:hypothetical protein